jgi:hypothetical protein
LSRKHQRAGRLPPDDLEGGCAVGILRPRVLSSLPQAHGIYLFEEVQKLCRHYLRNRRVSPSEISLEDLISEVWEKFLGATSLPNDDEELLSDPSEWSLDPDTPEQDGRVVWLHREMQKTCGAQALAHRCEDIRRKRWGRAMSEGGRRVVQPDENEDFSDIGSDCDQEAVLQEADARDVWRGLLLLVEQELSPDDDVVKLLSLLKRQPDIFDDMPGMRWPIGALIELLDRDFPPPPPWNDDRVDNAKRRLRRWIKGLMRKNGFDVIDLEALFARVARHEDLDRQVVRTGSRPEKLHS